MKRHARDSVKQQRMLEIKRLKTIEAMKHEKQSELKIFEDGFVRGLEYALMLFLVCKPQNNYSLKDIEEYKDLEKEFED